MNNILKQPKLPPKTPFQYTPKITSYQFKPLKVACGCGDIQSDESYIYSERTGEHYCDLYCFCKKENVEYSDAHRQQIKEYYEIEMIG